MLALRNLLRHPPPSTLQRTLRPFTSATSPTPDKIKGVDVRVGDLIDVSEGSNTLILALVKKSQKVKPGKGGAFNNLELVQLKSGKKMIMRLRSDDAVEKVRLDETQLYSVMYKDDGIIHLMHSDTFDQIEVNSELIEGGDAMLPFLLEGLEGVMVEGYSGSIINIRAPTNITLKVQYTDRLTTGATSDKGAFKTGELENGVSIQMPPFIETGDEIVVNSETREYVGRP